MLGQGCVLSFPFSFLMSGHRFLSILTSFQELVAALEFRLISVYTMLTVMSGVLTVDSLCRRSFWVQAQRTHHGYC